MILRDRNDGKNYHTKIFRSRKSSCKNTHKFIFLVIHIFHYLKMTKYWFQISRNKVHEHCEFQKSHSLHYPQDNFFTISSLCHAKLSPPLLEDPSRVQAILFYPNCHSFFTMSCLLAQILCFSYLQYSLLLIKPTNPIILMTLP